MLKYMVVLVDSFCLRKANSLTETLKSVYYLFIYRTLSHQFTMIVISQQSEKRRTSRITLVDVSAYQLFALC